MLAHVLLSQSFSNLGVINVNVTGPAAYDFSSARSDGRGEKSYELDWAQTRALCKALPIIWRELATEDIFFARNDMVLASNKYGQDILIPDQDRLCHVGLANALGATFDSKQTDTIAVAIASNIRSVSSLPDNQNNIDAPEQLSLQAEDRERRQRAVPSPCRSGCCP